MIITFRTAWPVMIVHHVVFQAVGAVYISVLQDMFLRWRMALFDASQWTNSRI
jgi:hypothetical protein